MELEGWRGEEEKREGKSWSEYIAWKIIVYKKEKNRELENYFQQFK